MQPLMQGGGKKLDNKNILASINFNILFFSGVSVRYFTNARKITQYFQFFHLKVLFSKSYSTPLKQNRLKCLNSFGDEYLSDSTHINPAAHVPTQN